MPNWQSQANTIKHDMASDLNCVMHNERIVGFIRVACIPPLYGLMLVEFVGQVDYFLRAEKYAVVLLSAASSD